MKEPYILFQNLKRARLAAGLSQKELAQKLGISFKTISAYETGRAIPPSHTLAKIAQITKVTVGEIIGEKKRSTAHNGVERRLKDLEERVADLEKAVIKLIASR
jgi:transcriptional regulator with XRE-family HTH domain